MPRRNRSTDRWASTLPCFSPLWRWVVYTTVDFWAGGCPERVARNLQWRPGARGTTGLETRDASAWEACVGGAVGCCQSPLRDLGCAQSESDLRSWGHDPGHGFVSRKVSAR